MNINKKEAKRLYKETPPAIGIYLIKNNINNKCLIGMSTNIPGIFNRIKFELKLKVHRNPVLMEEWVTFGEENFSFEILDTIEPNQEPNYDYFHDLTALLELWVEQISPFGY